MRVTLGLLLVASIGCSKKATNGLPAATEWQAEDQTAGVDPSLRPRAVTPPSNDPHAGIAGAPPIGAGEGEEGDEQGGGMMGGGNVDPHAGIVGAPPIAGGGSMPPTVDVTKMGLSAPDKNRPIDPTHRIRGILKLDPKTKDKLKPDGAIFLIVKRPDAKGNPAGPPLAVDKVAWIKDGMPFELTEAQAMVAGTELTGDVIVMARYDQDSDAITKQPGDVTGMARVKVPAENVVLSLDTILQ